MTSSLRERLLLQFVVACQGTSNGLSSEHTKRKRNSEEIARLFFTARQILKTGVLRPGRKFGKRGMVTLESIELALQPMPAFHLAAAGRKIHPLARGR